MSLAGAKVVITGGAGFIGSELTHQLCAAGTEVCVLDNLVNGSEALLAFEGVPRPRFVLGDVRDSTLLRETLRDCEILFHLACLGVRHSLTHPFENHDVNATGALRVFEAALESRVRRVVHVSTSEVYGTAETVPMTESHPTRPSTVYGASKLAGENYARTLGLTHGLPVVIVRPFNAYGPRSHHLGDAGEVIPRFIVNLMKGQPLQVFGNGLQTRDFNFVADTARGILQAGIVDGAEGQTIHLGSGLETSILELGEKLASLLKVSPVFHRLPERPGDLDRLAADSTRASKLLGWQPRVNLNDGLSQTVQWFARHLIK